MRSCWIGWKWDLMGAKARDVVKSAVRASSLMGVERLFIINLVGLRF